MGAPTGAERLAEKREFAKQWNLDLGADEVLLRQTADHETITMLDHGRRLGLTLAGRPAQL